MPKKLKLSLSQFKVKSFITSLESSKIKAGDTLTKAPGPCYTDYEETCPIACETMGYATCTCTEGTCCGSEGTECQSLDGACTVNPDLCVSYAC